MQSIVLGLAFLLELALLVAVGYWGFQTGTGIMAWVLGLGAPLLVAVVWGIWLAPKSSRRLGIPIRLIVEAGLFALGTAALWIAGQPTLAVIFGALAALDMSLRTVMRLH